MEIKVTVKDGEYWWGGSSNQYEKLPLNKDSEFLMERTYTSNQTMPFWASTKGRYVYSAKAMDVALKDGELTFTGDADIELCEAGETLRDAYIAGSNKHFPPHGNPINRDFFKTVQYNTWIEMLYDPTQEAVLKYAHEIINHGFQPGILMIDEGWHGRYGIWEFDKAKFPDPKAMVDELHALGFKVLLWVVPLLTADGRFYLDNVSKRKEHPICVRDKNGWITLCRWWNGISAILDFTNPDDKKFFKDRIDPLMRDYGIDGFKFDGGNAHMYAPEIFFERKPCTKNDMYEMCIAYNEFGTQYEYHEFKDTYGCGGLRQIQRLRDRRHTFDDNGLNSLIVSGIDAGLIGHPYMCPDMVGGGSWSDFVPGKTIDGELFVRWAQCSAFFPMMQYSKSPWGCLDKEHCDLVIEAGKLHNSLTDYILKCVDESEKTGEPIIRALSYNYPGENLENITDEFMLGEEILAAPVLEKGAVERTVILPSGKWQDSDGKVYEGSNTYKINAPLEKNVWFKKC